MGKFVLKKASNGEFYFRLQAGNGESIVTTEGYADQVFLFSAGGPWRGIDSELKRWPGVCSNEALTS